MFIAKLRVGDGEANHAEEALAKGSTFEECLYELSQVKGLEANLLHPNIEVVISCAEKQTNLVEDEV